MAMLGVYIAGFVAKARAQGPAALAKAQDAARGYLRRVLGMNPDLLTFGEHGLALRPLVLASSKLDAFLGADPLGVQRVLDLPHLGDEVGRLDQCPGCVSARDD